MKQPEDNKTVDMFGGSTPEAITNTSQRVNTYRFYIVRANDDVVTWGNLTKAVAEMMYANTEQHLPEGVRAYGWECEGGERLTE